LLQYNEVNYTPEYEGYKATVDANNLAGYSPIETLKTSSSTLPDNASLKGQRKAGGDE
jgi:hypothetical protein